ncbi:MAG: hypothetical protein J5730_05575 [Bacteroidales bacterium]|nr:hypothetical protein [Bacteroidales bacterium]
MNKHIPLIIISVLLTYPTQAQVDSSYRQIEQVADELESSLEHWDGEAALSEEIVEELFEEFPNNINLNDLSYETAVKKLHFTDYQYYQLQLYIEEHGALASIYELAAIDGFSNADVERLSGSVVAQPVRQRQNFFRNFFRKSSCNLLVRHGQVLERQAGYDTSRAHHYAGSPGHDCFRLSFNSQDKVILKVSGEKDAGEQFFRGEQRAGFDFYAGSLCIQDIGVLQRVVLGDFRLNFGQGLAMGSSLLSGRGGSTESMRRFSTGFRAVTPTNEGDFLRGAAITLGNHRLSGSLFAARRFGGFNNAYGADLSYQRALFRIGVRAMAFSTSDTARASPGERIVDFLSPTGFNVAADYHLIAKRHLLFGEAAVNSKGKVAILQAAKFNLAPTLKLLLLFRHYSRDFSAPLGKGFGATSHNSGETGLYWAAEYIAGKDCELSLYADYYRLTAPSYRTDAPVAGLECGLSLLYRMGRSSQLICKYSWRSRPQNGGEDMHLHAIADRLRHKVRLQWSGAPYPWLKLKSEIDWIFQRENDTRKHYQGLLLFQDAAVDITRIGLALHARIAYFDTDRYEERIYAYENDLYYTFTIGSYYYKGIRGYLMLRYRYRWVSVWLRLARTHYIDRQTVGSGLNQIDAPHKTEIKAQIMFSI